MCLPRKHVFLDHTLTAFFPVTVEISATLKTVIKQQVRWLFHPCTILIKISCLNCFLVDSKLKHDPGKKTFSVPCVCTGRCASGNCGKAANSQRSGEVCQYSDLLHGKQARLRDLYDHTSIIFNGTLTDKCNITYPETQDTLEWIIDLGDVYHIEAISTTNKMLHYGNCISKLSTGTEKLPHDYHRCHLQFSMINHSSSIHLEDITRCDLYGHLLTIVPVYNCIFDKSPVAYVPLCEVEVLGKPYIDINCSHCLQYDSSPCGNGVWCEQCAPGWRPPDCKRTCQAGYFGINCQQKCVVPDKYSCCTWITCNKVTGEVEEGSMCIEWHTSFQSVPKPKCSGISLIQLIVILAGVCVVLAIVVWRKQTIIAWYKSQQGSKMNKASIKPQRQQTLAEYENVNTAHQMELSSETPSVVCKQEVTKPSKQLYINVATVNAENSGYNSDKNSERQYNRGKGGSDMEYSSLCTATIDKPTPSIYEALSHV